MTSPTADTLIPWLLDAATPAIRYLTRRDLLHLPPDHPDLQRDQVALMTTGLIPLMFAGQHETGYQRGEASHYTPKYRSTHWTLTLLIEHAVDPADPRLQNAVAHMLTRVVGEMEAYITQDGGGWGCFRGNLLRYALYAGQQADPRVHAISAATATAILRQQMRCKHHSGLPCAWGLVRGLWGLAALPVSQRDPLIKDALAAGTEFLLNGTRLLKLDYPLPPDGKVHPVWTKFNFPLFYQTDRLFTLRVLADLDALHHPDAAPVLDWLVAQCGPSGRWRGTSPYRSRTWHTDDDSGDTDRWVSLHAALVLQKAGRLT